QSDGPGRVRCACRSRALAQRPRAVILPALEAALEGRLVDERAVQRTHVLTVVAPLRRLEATAIGVLLHGLEAAPLGLRQRAPPAPKRAAPSRPKAMIGPMPGTARLTAAPIGKPTPAPVAMPVTAPIAAPVPGASPSSIGIAASRRPSAPGVNSVRWSREMPNDARRCTARSAASRDVKMPATDFMESSRMQKQQTRCQRTERGITTSTYDGVSRSSAARTRSRPPPAGLPLTRPRARIGHSRGGFVPMPQLSRRAFVAGSIATAAVTRAPFVHAQRRGGTLRFVPHADLKVLDPIWTTAYI